MLAWILTLLRLPIAAAFAVVTGCVARPGGGGIDAVAAVILLSLAALAETSDLVDGWAARRHGTVSELGGLADPLCDSLARLTIFFSAALAGWIWIGVPLVMAARDILVAYIRVALARTGRRTTARASGKVKAVVQGAAVLAVVFLAGPWAQAMKAVELYRGAIAGAVIAVTLWSLLDYARAGSPAVCRMARNDG